MANIKYYTVGILFLLNFGIHIHAQETVSNDPETIQNTIDYRITQAQYDLDNNNYYPAKKKLEEALQLAEELDNKKSIGLIYSKIGKLEHIIDENDEALKTITKAIEVQRFSKDNVNLADTYKTLGNIYMSLNEYDQALTYYISSLTLFEQEGLSEFEAEVLLNQGKAYIELKQYRKARERLEKSLALTQRYDLKKIRSSALIYQARVYYFLNENEEALNLGNQGIQIAEINNFTDVLNHGYLILSELNEKLGNYQLSTQFLKNHITLSKKLLEIKHQNLSPEKRAKFILDNQTEYQKEKEADLEKLKVDKSLNKLATILSIALITILSLLTLSLYKNNNIRLKTNNMLHKKNAELILAKEKAELASKTKANFLSTVTHELRTPLYAVTGLTNMLLDENPKPNQIQHLKSLKFSGDYLLTFINDILQINKIEANKVDIEYEVFDLRRKITDVISALKNSATDNGVEIHFEYDMNIPLHFKADQIKLSQILINLIGNSIKFTKDGDIWVRVIKVNETPDGIFNLKFEVEDNGIGITPEKQKHMFESFSQGSIQINRKYGGTGLGLSIVKGLIDILNGKIYLKSELNKGTTFFFEIPLKYTTEEVPTEQNKNYFKDVTANELSNIKILVVEDNKINQMITNKILTKMKLNCDIVDNGEEAVDMVKNNHYDVVLMDIHMPGISGIEATKIIRTFDRELNIFALTAVTIEDKMKEFEEAGFDDIISKPFKQEDFEKKLFNAVIGNKDAKS
ncbi:tetratricopeptide repeat-containing hybrid sensor histidine kinase/response regulator [Formosa algae]|uniref:histidine kinase n=1 Tax=Formosa algae TaxID=225843 RepID=A0A9X0YJH1_9FLAO|nr:ATP-binding protein [Formosa algae]MBP1839053.1 signal transduction histidine kinase/CheY-like chemotaxis protein [Formosa algae]MDQ0333830.1 signal transduction histidine kinase/CheY-like chemotaxis protein [Formosa algae]OEI80890.1 hybrid sensor histidine kinase/response regulator [Formosa algae]